MSQRKILRQKEGRTTSLSNDEEAKEGGVGGEVAPFD